MAVIATELWLPWPPRECSPNWRGHWAVKSRAAKNARHGAYMLAVAAGWHRQTWPGGKLHFWLDFFPPDRRARDDDNLLAAAKNQRDGVAEAIGIDDKRVVSHPFVRDFDPAHKGQVRLRITGGGIE